MKKNRNRPQVEIQTQKNPEPVSDLFFEIVQIYLVNSDLGMYL